MNAFTMWEERIVFLDGWFVYMDGKGNNSIISHQRARMLEQGYQRYQAGMDIARGGAPKEVAYPSRGFTCKGNEYVYETFRVDKLIVGKVNPIPNILKIPKSVGNIKINSVAEEAFKNESAIKKLVLHENIHNIKKSAFEGCVNLCDVSQPDNTHIEIGEDAFKDTLLYSEGTIYINNVLVKVQSSFKGVLKVKEGTLAIADNALQECAQITRIELPDGLISIGQYAFHNCTSLTDLIFPESLNIIGQYAFSNCYGLSKIKMPTFMKKIGVGAFQNCNSLDSIVLPEGISDIAGAMFYRCVKLMNINIPTTVKKIMNGAFDESGLFDIYKNSTDTELYIDDWLIHYKGDMLSTLYIKEGTIGISDMHRSQPNRVQTVILPKSLKYIGDSAFERSSIALINFPKTLRYIGNSAFRGTALKTICIPSSVRQIDYWAFMDCEHIEKIIINGSKTTIIWPAITGRKDKKEITIVAPIKSNANKYCIKYGQKNNLVFKPLVAGFIKNIFKK